jgi:glycosyltransferase involved in cell wall biosynthesis
MKKIAFIAVNDTAPWGGSEELWAQTALRMAQMGYTIGASVKGWKTKPAKIAELEQSQISVTYRNSDRNKLDKAAFFLHRGKQFYQWLDRFRPDLALISQSANCDGLLWMEACAQRDIPYAVVSHVAAENHWIPDSSAARLAQAFAQAKQSFFVSQDNIDLTAKQIGANIPNASVIRSPYNVSRHAAPLWLPTEKGFKLACVGRMHPTSKGQDLILEVMRLEKWRDRPLTVTFFGEGEHKESLKRLADLWNLENVKFGQFTSDVESIWENHHALILPSRYEGGPLVTVEAMLCGRPCIVTNLALNKECIQDNVNGFLIKAPIAELVDEALERAWQQRENWYELGKAAAVKVRQVIPADPISVFTEKIVNLLN